MIIYVYGEKDDITESPEINISFSDGMIEKFRPCRIIDSLNYVEFKVAKDQMIKLSQERFDYLSINSAGAVQWWIDINYSKREYFRWFLNNYRKRVDKEILTRNSSPYEMFLSSL